MRRWIVITILSQLEPCTGNQWNVHRPRRIAHPDFTLCARSFENFCSQTHGTAATRSLNGTNASRSGRQDIGAYNKLDQPTYEAGITLRRDVGLGLLLIDKLMLSQSNSIKHRAVPGLIHINTDGQVHFVGVRISSALCGQAEYGIGRQYG